MKYIIILLTSLFLVSNASAEAIKQICERTKNKIIYKEEQKDKAIFSLLKFKNNTPEWDEKKKEIDSLDANQLKIAKLYHYLDCREELER